MTLHAERLACERGGLRLFSDVSLTLRPGGLLRVRGANGRGKTTLLRTLAGLTRPVEGRIRWNEADVDPEFHRHMLFIGHAPALKDELTVLENLAFSLRLSGVWGGTGASGASGLPVAESEIRAALERLGIAHLANLPARYLSQGQRRRTSLARLPLSKRIPLWLLDEPFAALDTAGIDRLAALCAEHLAEGGLVILTSHQDVDIACAAPQSLDLGS